MHGTPGGGFPDADTLTHPQAAPWWPEGPPGHAPVVLVTATKADALGAFEALNGIEDESDEPGAQRFANTYIAALVAIEGVPPDEVVRVLRAVGARDVLLAMGDDQAADIRADGKVMRLPITGSLAHYLGREDRPAAALAGLVVEANRAWRPRRERASVATAGSFLRGLLADGRPVPAAEVKLAATRAGISWRSIDRAKAASDIRAIKTGRTWTWLA